MARFTPAKRTLWQKIKYGFEVLAFGVAAAVAVFGTILFWLLLATGPILVVLLAIKYLFF